MRAAGSSARGAIRLSPVMRLPRQRREAGFTLVELMIAIFVLLVGVLGSVALVDGANRTSSSTRAREGGTNLARDVFEAARLLKIGDVVSKTADFQSLLGSGSLADSSGAAGWQVSRRGFTYTIALTACAVDDGQDRAGTHDGSINWSSGSAAGASDAQDPHHRRI